MMCRTRSILRLCLLLALLVVAAPPAAAGPPAAAPAAAVTTAPAAADPAVRVVPATGLTGQTPVRITARGLPANTPVEVTLCDRPPGDDGGETECLTRLAADQVTDARGRLALGAQPPALAYFDHETFHTHPIYCRADGCAVYVAWRDEAGEIAGSVASRTLTFVGSPATITASVTDGLADGQRVRVTGTALGSDAPYVSILEQQCSQRLFEVDCQPELPLATVRLRPNDTFAATVRVFRVLPGNSDCVDDDEIVECYLVARILQYGYTGADETYGVPAYGHPRVEIEFAP